MNGPKEAAAPPSRLEIGQALAQAAAARNLVALVEPLLRDDPASDDPAPAADDADSLASLVGAVAQTIAEGWAKAMGAGASAGAVFPAPPDFTPEEAEDDPEQPPADLHPPPRPSPLAAARQRATKADAAGRAAHRRAVGACERIAEVAAGRAPDALVQEAGDSAKACLIEARKWAVAASDSAQRALDSSDASTARTLAEEADGRAGEAARPAAAAEAWADRAAKHVRRKVARENRVAVADSVHDACERLRRLHIPEGPSIEDRRARIRVAIEFEVLSRLRETIQEKSGTTHPGAIMPPPPPAEPAGREPLPKAGLLGTNPLPEALSEQDWQFVALQPNLAYSVACYLVRWRGVPFDEPPLPALFEAAVTSEVQARFVASDPELTTASDEKGFARLKARAAAVVQAIDAADEKMRAAASTPEEA